MIASLSSVSADVVHHEAVEIREMSSGVDPCVTGAAADAVACAEVGLLIGRHVDNRRRPEYSGAWARFDSRACNCSGQEAHDCYERFFPLLRTRKAGVCNRGLPAYLWGDTDEARRHHTRSEVCSPSKRRLHCVIGGPLATSMPIRALIWSYIKRSPALLFWIQRFIRGRDSRIL
jgi:hypothetical protein